MKTLGQLVIAEEFHLLRLKYIFVELLWTIYLNNSQRYVWFGASNNTNI